MIWKTIERPGMFGKSRDKKIKSYNDNYGPGNWRMVWIFGELEYEFIDACINLYEMSYHKYLSDNPHLINYICSHREVIDNALSNIKSGLDYSVQESSSTHIQDIAIRRVIYNLGKSFDPNSIKLLEVRSSKSNGAKFSPGVIPFFAPEKIIKPSKCPRWANYGSVEDIWQSNKVIQIKTSDQ